MNRILKKIGFRYAIVLAAICSILPFVSLALNEWKDAMSENLFNLSLMALFCAFGEFIIMDSEEHTYGKKEVLIRFILHYLYINVVVLFFGFKVGWFDFHNYIELVITFVMIAVIYFVNTLVSYHKEKSLAEKMNQKLSKLQDLEEENF